MRLILLCFVFLVFAACGEQTYDGECTYFSNIHSTVDTDACLAEGDAQGCESTELDDRSAGDETVLACVYTECPLDADTPDFDCEKFRSI